jgi:hypothetical protein
VSEDEMGGPLGELLAHLPPVPDDAPREPVHARVLPVATADGAELVFVCWRDPGGARALFDALRRRVEGSFLGELSRSAEELAESGSALTGLRLFIFCEVEGVENAVRAFGLARTGGRDAQSRASLARVRHEAGLFGEEIGEEPVAVFAATTREMPLTKTVEEELVAVTGDVWGKNPGAPFARLRQAIARAGGPTITPTLEGIAACEALLFTDQPNVIRWLGPLTFQALCDLVAVAIDRELGRKVDWAEAAPDEDGIAPPPMIRIDGSVHVPLALEILRFSVMPRMQDEEPLALAEWVQKSFGATQ